MLSAFFTTIKKTKLGCSLPSAHPCLLLVGFRSKKLLVGWTMSVLAQGNPTSRGVEDDILLPLLARLTTIKAFLDAAATVTPSLSAPATDPNTSQSEAPTASQDAAGDVRFQARELLNKIEREMAALRGLFRRIDNIEKSMRHRFDPVEQHIDDALLELHIDDALHHHVNRVHAELSAVDAEVEDIMAKIRKSYIVPSEGDQGRNAPATRVPSPSMAMAKTKKMAEIQRSPQMRHLSLVVGGLEARARGCVLCLAVFPEGAVIKKRLLIHWWIGEGFVESADAGKERFDELVAKGFVIPVPSALCSTVHRCKVRPWMRDLLIDVARSNGFFEQDSDDFTLARRACLQSRKVRSAFCAGVRTIYNINQKYVELDERWFPGKKELCTLQLGQWREFGPRDQIANPIVSHIEVSGVERLADVESCKSLRYISFRGMSRIESLPDSIGKLRELVVLDLRACHNLEDLGEGITKLDKLEYLDLSECHLLVGMPKGLGRLTRLEVLKGFVVANTNSKDPCHLNELTKLEKLRKLGIVIGKLAVPTEDEFLKLSEFKALESLTIRWGVQRVHTAESEKNKNAEEAASHLVTTMKLPPNLKKLDLHCFPLPDFPQWVPEGVKKLYIRGGKLATLGDAEKDWKVEVLRLRFLRACSATRWLLDSRRSGMEQHRTRSLREARSGKLGGIAV